MMRCLYERRAPTIAISHTLLPATANKYSEIFNLLDISVSQNMVTVKFRHPMELQNFWDAFVLKCNYSL